MVDDWNTPMLAAARYGYYDQMALTLRRMVEIAVGANDCVEFSVLMGCLHIPFGGGYFDPYSYKYDSILRGQALNAGGFDESDIKEITEYYGLYRFYHKNLLTEMDNRDFESVEQMNEVMIEKWNKKVHARDEVVILGDLSLGNGKETNEILCRLKGRLCLIRGNHDERYLRDRDFDASRFEWVKDYAEIHDNKRKIVLMHYPIFCYNGQFRRGAGGTPLTYMLHGHIHKTTDQELVDRFCAETRAVLRKSAHQETAQPVPCQMINCFCMYSDYTPLTLEEWVECDQRRRGKADCG